MDETALSVFHEDLQVRFPPKAASDAKSGGDTKRETLETRREDNEKDISAEDVELQRIEKQLVLQDCFERLTETHPGGMWRLLTTAKFHALVPTETESGDCICVVPGVAVPLVFRPVPKVEAESHDLDGDFFWLIGPAYVHGYMDGLAVRERQAGVLEEIMMHVL